MTDLAGPVVLNVDDQDVQRYIKTRDLKESDFSVIEASTGAEALRLVEELRPPVVLLDVQLPDITGFDVCAFIKKKWPETMVLMTSATFITSPSRTRGLDSGADMFLVQPAEPLELAAGIRALLRIRQSEDALRSLNASLEQRVQDRVVELVETNARLSQEIAQRRKAEAALVQAQKMEAVGQLTGGLAHDFNNLLTAVVGNLDLIRARATDPRIARLAEHAFKAAERGSKLTAQLLAFSRIQKLETEPVDVNRLIRGMSELLKQSIGPAISITFDLDEELPAALADMNQLELAILNLSINARDAMEDTGVLTIATRHDNDAGRVTIAVGDTGSGMSPDVIARAFDPFFTTKPPGKGTGLGLSQVHGIVRQLGGEVTIDSKLGEGSTIRIALPAAAADAERKGHAASELKVGHAERVLVVDDDPDVRGIMTTFLAELGYDIREAADFAGALAALNDYAPHLLIVDFAMPGTNGAEVAVAVRQKHPGLPILFVSGYSDSAALQSAVGDTMLLRKPFRPVELAAAVRSVLEAAMRPA
jgi:signal transduction histidine kinase